MCVYIYIYREREREGERYAYTCIYPLDIRGYRIVVALVWNSGRRLCN